MLSRQVLQDLGQELARAPDEVAMPLLAQTIERLQPRLVVFEEPVTDLRKKLAALYEKNGEWVEAAKVLIGIPLESSNRCGPPPNEPTCATAGAEAVAGDCPPVLPCGGRHSVVPVTDKLETYVKIAQLYLEVHDETSAEAYINRASLIIHECQDPSIHIGFKVRCAPACA